MKTLDELKAFCEGYRMATLTADLPTTDDWITWGGYDINFIGSEYAEQATDDDLFCVAYDCLWTENLREPIHWFIV